MQTKDANMMSKPKNQNYLLKLNEKGEENHNKSQNRQKEKNDQNFNEFKETVNQLFKENLEKAVSHSNF